MESIRTKLLAALLPLMLALAVATCCALPSVALADSAEATEQEQQLAAQDDSQAESESVVTDELTAESTDSDAALLSSTESTDTSTDTTSDATDDEEATGETESDQTEAEEEEEEAEPTTLSGSAYVQGSGWKSTSTELDSALTLGSSSGKKLSGITLSLANSEVSGSIKYRVYYVSGGWQSWGADGSESGSSSTSSYVQAVQIKLSGNLASSYDVYYRAYVYGYGWLDWTSNGNTAGVSGLTRSVRAIQVQIVAKGSSAPGDTTTPYVNKATLKVQVNLSSSGWLSKVSAGSKAGKTSTSQRLTAVKITMSSKVSGSIKYRVSYASDGWQSWVTDGSKAGKVSTSKYVQAIQIKLTGEAAKYYDVYYQVYVQGYGWLDWASNGSTAGTTGLKMRATAIRVKIVAKDAAFSGSTSVPYVRKGTLSVSTCLSSSGWLSSVASGKTSGKASTSQSMTALKVSMSAPMSGSIKYRVNYSGVGWQDWASNGSASGDESSSNFIQAIQVKLTGKAASYYDIYYRVYIQGYGWLGWAKNGGKAGTTGYSLRVTAVQVKIVMKGSDAPGSTKYSLIQVGATPSSYSNTTAKIQMLAKAQSYSSDTKYLILVDRVRNRTGVYVGSKGNWKQVYYWKCTTGAAGTITPKGVYTIGYRGYSFGSGYTCYYYTQIYKSILFHSVKYYQGTMKILDGRLGVNASHGCVRLAIANAKWIYDNIPRNTKVVIYAGSA